MGVRPISFLIVITTFTGCWPAYAPPTEVPAYSPTPSATASASPTATYRSDLVFDSVFDDGAPESSSIYLLENWSGGIPHSGDPELEDTQTPPEDYDQTIRGGIGSDFIATVDLDGEPTPLEEMDLTLFGNATLFVEGTFSISNAHIQFVDRSRFENHDYETILQGQEDGFTFLGVSDGAQAYFGDLLLGRGGEAVVHQAGGLVYVQSILEIGDEQAGRSSIYHLSGGTLRTSDLETVAGLGYGTLNFPLASSGTLQVQGENKSLDELQRLVTQGALTLGSYVMPPGDFDFQSVSIDGLDYSQVRISNRGQVAHYAFEEDARDISGEQNDPRAISGETRIISDAERGQVFDFRQNTEIQLPNMQTLFDGAGTFMLWLKADDLTNSLLARFEFESEDTLTKDKTQGLSAVTIATPHWSPEGGEHVGALLLDGKSALEVDATVLGAADAKGSGFFSAWVYLDSLEPDAQYLFGCEEDNERLYFLRVLKGGTLEASLGDVGETVRSTTRLKSRTWQHVTYRWKHGSTVEMYVDGLIAGDSGEALFESPWDVEKGRFYIGASFQGSSLTGFLSGKMDDVRLYSDRLSTGSAAYLIRDISPFIVGDPLTDSEPRTLFPRGAAGFLVAGLGKERRTYGLSANGVLVTGYDKYQWSHHAFVMEPGEPGTQRYHHFINGIELNSDLTVGQFPMEGDGSFFIRTTPRLGSGELGSDSTLLFDGKMDDVRFFNRALSPEEVKLYVPEG